MNNMSHEFTEPIWEDIFEFKLLNKTKIFIAGDSTACNYPHNGANNRYPRTGWGQVFGERFDNSIQIVNCALSGRSSKSFLYEPNFDFIYRKISYGDYLIIQFGHNDCKSEDLSRYTSPKDRTFQECLCKYIAVARRVGAHPILATPVTRNIIDDETLVPYCDAIKTLGKTEQIPVMDIYTLSHEQLVNSPVAHSHMYMILKPYDPRFIGFSGFNESEYYKDGCIDNTHLNINGARYISKLASYELRRLRHPLAEHLLG